VKDLYNLDKEGCIELIINIKKVKSHNVGELWHKSFSHFHHGTLKIMHKITNGLLKGAFE